MLDHPNMTGISDKGVNFQGCVILCILEAVGSCILGCPAAVEALLRVSIDVGSLVHAPAPVLRNTSFTWGYQGSYLAIDSLKNWLLDDDPDWDG